MYRRPAHLAQLTAVGAGIYQPSIRKGCPHFGGVNPQAAEQVGGILWLSWDSQGQAGSGTVTLIHGFQQFSKDDMTCQ